LGSWGAKRRIIPLSPQKWNKPGSAGFLFLFEYPKQTCLLKGTRIKIKLARRALFILLGAPNGIMIPLQRENDPVHGQGLFGRESVGNLYCGNLLFLIPPPAQCERARGIDLFRI